MTESGRYRVADTERGTYREGYIQRASGRYRMTDTEWH